MDSHDACAKKIKVNMETDSRLATPILVMDRASSAVTPSSLPSSSSSSSSTSDLASPVIQVKVDCIINPDQGKDDEEDNFKTVPVTINTTASEVVSVLINDNHDGEEAEEFCLLECIENDRGNYKRVVPDREKVLLTRQKWRKKGDGHFLLIHKKDGEYYRKGLSHLDSSSYLYFFTPSPQSIRRQRRHSLPSKDAPPPSLIFSEHFHSRQSFEEKQKSKTSNDSPSLSQGQKSMKMSKIMNQVVKETSLLQQRRGSLNITSMQRLVPIQTMPKKDSTSLPVSPTPPDIISIEPLICSPSYSAVRAFPELVQSPTPSSPEAKTADKTSECQSPTKNTLETLTEADQDSSDETLQVSLVKTKDEKRDSLDKSIKEMEEGPLLVHTVVMREHYPVHPKKVFVKNSLLEAEPTSLSKDEAITTSSLVKATNTTSTESPPPAPPTVIGIENSEMDLIDSLTSILDSKLSACRDPSQDSDDADARLVGDLLSPKRRASLVDEACSNIKRKRSVTHSSEQPKIPNRFQTPPRQISRSSSALVSPTRRDELITAASEIILDARKKKSLGDVAHSQENEEETVQEQSQSHTSPHILNFEDFQLISEDKADQNDRDASSEVMVGGGGSLDDSIITKGVRGGGEEGSPDIRSKLRRHKSERFKPRLLSIFNKKVKSPVERREEEVGEGGGGGRRHKTQYYSPKVPFKRSRSDHHFNKV